MNRKQDSDEGLMQRAVQGDRDCLATLIRRYSSPLLTYIQRMIADRHRSEELLQEVFLRVWTRRHHYRFPRPFRSWLYAIATNHCRAEFRRPRLEFVAAAGEDDEYPVPMTGVDSPVEAAISTETGQLVTTSVTQLPPRQRAVVVLRVWNGLTYGEIAQVLGCGEDTARSHMHHGLAAMRKFLEPRLH